MKRIFFVITLCLLPLESFANFGEETAASLAQLRAKLVVHLTDGTYSGHLTDCHYLVDDFNESRQTAIQAVEALQQNADAIRAVPWLNRDNDCK